MNVLFFKAFLVFQCLTAITHVEHPQHNFQYSALPQWKKGVSYQENVSTPFVTTHWLECGGQKRGEDRKKELRNLSIRSLSRKSGAISTYEKTCQFEITPFAIVGFPDNLRLIPLGARTQAHDSEIRVRSEWEVRGEWVCGQVTRKTNTR